MKTITAVLVAVTIAMVVASGLAVMGAATVGRPLGPTLALYLGAVGLFATSLSGWYAANRPHRTRW